MTDVESLACLQRILDFKDTRESYGGWRMVGRWVRLLAAGCGVWVGLQVSGWAGSGLGGGGEMGVVEQDVVRFSGALRSRVAERRVAGVQGLGHLKHWPAESLVLPLLDDAADTVRLAAVEAVVRLGGVPAVPRLIERLEDACWEVRQQAWLGLCRITALEYGVGDRAAWGSWWRGAGLEAHERELWQQVAQAAPGRRRAALRALVHLSRGESEGALLGLLREPQSPSLDAEERGAVCEALERVGSERAIAVLAAERSDAAAWALGRLGGIEAERALLGFPRTLPVLLALDRLGSTNTAGLVPELVAQMGQITYRGQPDDVMNEDLQPIQRVAARLIRRSGMAGMLIERVLYELEATQPARGVGGKAPAVPADWEAMMRRMRSELKPGFVREDGVTTSQPLVAMCYTVREAVWVPRLLGLLRHPALVVRVYVALALGRLHAVEAVAPLAAMIREGYEFSDAVALASGKHFEHSQTVRWRGFLCLALGRLGGDAARRELESLAVDADQPRDVRYGSVVGLGFLGAPGSLAVVERVAATDLIWQVRDEARRVADELRWDALEEP